ncbi:non-ribosomal peptide synthetase [Bacillus pseudomycoides]|uniref:non-ribosomal peptide synthetase n=1 Tax=Bacillus pseudomycoides TaxID=64104 RepID=UPI000BED4E13|nr:non-ribosomal peptide synthetase [Bacillus pseudomycoides]PDZ70797.1 hypothetical protein CON58_26895 [Bacillus pseudomycoides]
MNLNTIHGLFEEQVKRTPHDPALVFHGKTLTYIELNNKANQFARFLSSNSIGRERKVAIAIERSLEMIVSILGILKSDGAYVPIDITLPSERINYIIEDSNIDLIVTNSKNAHKFNSVNVTCLNIDNKSLDIYEGTNLCGISDENNLAYVIYTSGTTGKPKGVAIEHKSITNALYWRKQEYTLNKEDNVLQLFSMAFDGFVTSLFTPLLSGSTVYLLDEIEMKDPFKITEYISKFYITHFISIPTIFSQILEVSSYKQLQSLRSVTLAGEKISDKLIQLYRQNNLAFEIVNEYGPTENSVVSTFKRNIEKDDIITIGKPIPNVNIYILDENFNPVNIGEEGEIYISGIGLARGYVNNNKLNQQRFISNPNLSGERLYKTGDLGVYLSDGNIRFIERIDHQVKINGYRIETNEIIHALNSFENLSECVVIANENFYGQSELICFYTSDQHIVDTALRTYLKNKLPNYMIPSRFINIETIPLTRNGKIDYKKLRSLINTSCSYYKDGVNKSNLEELLAEIWKKTLNLNEIEIDASFLEMGGNSIHMSRMLTEIYKELGVRVPFKTAYSLLTIRKLAEYLKDNKSSSFIMEIEPLQKQEYYDTTSIQKRMFFLNQLDTKSTNYNLPFALRIEGNLCVQQLKKALKSLIKRHAALRTSFEFRNNELFQKINEDIEFNLKEFVCNTDNIDEIISRFIEPFDLTQAPLFRAAITKLGESEYYLLIDSHHIICDGRSMEILLNDLVNIYDNKPLVELPMHYVEYATYSNNFSKTESYLKQKSFWDNEFKDETILSKFPTDYNRTEVQNFKGITKKIVLDTELTNKIKVFSRSNQVTTYVTLLTTLNVLLYKYTGNDIITIGTPVEGRNHLQTENIVGMFVNTLAVKNYIDSEDSIKKLMEMVGNKVFSIFDNQDYPFENLIKDLNLSGEKNRNPLFDIMFIMQSNSLIHFHKDLDSVSFKACNFERGISRFDLTFEIIENSNQIEINIIYNTELFKETTIDKIGKHYKNLISVIINNPEETIANINILSQSEQQNLLNDIRVSNEVVYNQKTFHRQFELQVEKTPNKIAIKDKDFCLTYGELNKKANKLAWLLRETNIKSNDVVAIFLEQSNYTIISMLAILKSGATFLPIDPNLPAERIDFILNDSSAKVIISTNQLINTLNYKGIIIDILDQDMWGINNEENLNIENHIEDNAYIIYTSGTTGKPKGVIIKQLSIANYARWISKFAGINEEDKIVIASSLNFDLGYTGLYSSLIVGGTVYIANKHVYSEPKELIEILQKENITWIKMTPTLYKMLKNYGLKIKSLEALRLIIFGGEPIDIKDIEDIICNKTEVEIINHYGPTECTIGCIAKKIDQFNIREFSQDISIGKPIHNTNIYIVNKNGQLQPNGFFGEIWVSGNGVAKGYINRPNLTKEKFVKPPFTENEIMYRTGDIGRRLYNGEIELKGRKDNQVKVKGYRIEITEIEKHILMLSEIRDCKVIVKTNNDGINEMYAYIVLNNEYLTINDLKESLMKCLPSYMIPSYFTSVEHIPITSNGKADIKKLSTLKGDPLITRDETIKPTTQLEQEIVSLWSEILNMSHEIGLEDDFFIIGGDSLKAVKVMYNIADKYGVNLSLREFFKKPTIKYLASVVSENSNLQHNNNSLFPINKQKYYSASSAQKRIYYLQKLENTEAAYNIPILLEWRGKLDGKLLYKTLCKLMERHEILRTNFDFINGSITQVIKEVQDAPFHIIDCKYQNIDDTLEKLATKVYDFNKEILFDSYLIKKSEERYYLFFTFNHIIMDGWSINVFLNELLKVYFGQDLGGEIVQYKEFSEWQSRMLLSDSYQEQLEYWKGIFPSTIPMLNIPVDYDYPSIQSFKGKRLNFIVDKSLFNQLKSFITNNKVTLFMLLLANYKILLSKYTNQKDIIVGVPVAARTQSKFKDTLGMFVNTLPLYTEVRLDETTVNIVQKVKENLLNAFKHQDYPLDELIKQLKINRQASRSSLFETMFTMQEVNSKVYSEQDIQVTKLNIDIKTSKFPISFYVHYQDEQLEISIEYRDDLFTDETIHKIKEDYLFLLETTIKGARISDILLPSHTFNLNVNLEVNFDW